MIIFIIAGCSKDNGEMEFENTPEKSEDVGEKYSNIEDKVYLAAGASDYDEVKSLLESDDNIPIDDSKLAQEEIGDSRILASVFPYEFEICKLLIDYGADLNTLNAKGCSYLHMTIDNSEFTKYENRLDIVQYLLENGADPNIVGKKMFNMTPLNYLMEKSPVFEYQYDEIYNMLIKYGADITTETLKTALDSDSGFIYAHDICRYLKENNTKTGLSETLEAIILEKSDKEIISLIKKGEYKYKDKKYIVWYAAATCGADVLECLKNKGFNMNIKNKCDMSLLDIAAGYNDSNVVKYLLEQGFDIDGGIAPKAQKDIEDAFWQSTELEMYTPVSFALVHGKKKNVETLLEAGAEFQRNSWVSAVFSRNKTAVDILVDNKFKQEEGFIFYCYSYGSDEMVKYLLDKGVSYDVSYEGKKLIFALRTSGENDRADLILKYGAKRNI